MSFLNDVTTFNRDRSILSPGQYGNATAPGLKIVRYIDHEKMSKKDKNGAMRYAFAVEALRPSKEALNGHKDGELPAELADYSGEATLFLTLHDSWLTPEIAALAFTEASRNKKTGEIGVDLVRKAIETGEVSQESVDKARVWLRQQLTQEMTQNNTPADQMEALLEENYHKRLVYISGKLGEFINLQDWKTGDRGNFNMALNPRELAGTQFAGRVKSRSFDGKDNAEVDSVYARSKKVG